METLTIGRGSFKNVNSITINSISEHILKLLIDLASLSSIQLGEQALQGSDDDSCLLTMQSNN